MGWGSGWKILILWDITEKSDLKCMKNQCIGCELPKKGGLDS